MITRVKCGCTHEFQDKVYGPGMRIANKTEKAPAPSQVTVRCTVCKTLHTVNKDRLK